MAEFVEFRCEEWVSEVDKLEKIRLFEPKEIKTLVTRRRELEYKLQRRSKVKEDFLKYIQFEIDFLRILTARREKTGINSNKGEIESKQINRVIRMFKQVIFRCPDDIKLWMSLFQFCKDVKQNTVMSKMLVRMLQYHTDKPDLWIYASDWELKEGKSIDNARQFLMKALRYHPSSEKLYISLFRLELRHMKNTIQLKNTKLMKNKWKPDEVAENIISGKVVDVIYKSATKAIDSADFKVKLLNIASKFKITTVIQNTILRDLITNHSEDEITWDSFAKRAYNGYDNNCEELLEIDEIEMNADETQEENDSVKKRIQKCINIYEKAVKKLNTPKMWSFYLDQIVQIYWENAQNSKYSMTDSKFLRNAMEGALASGHLAEDHLLSWIEVLKKSVSKNSYLEEILLKGTEIFPKSLALWHARVRYHLAYDEEKEGKATFEKAIEQVTDTSPLWELIIEYFKLKNSNEIETIFKKGLEKGGEVAESLKPRFLQWLATTKGLNEARKMFNTSCFKHPPNLELYKVMIELETKETNCDADKVRKCFDLAASYYGQNDPKIWLDYIGWEMKRGDITKVHHIHRRALNALHPEKVDDFLTEYNFIKINTS